MYKIQEMKFFQEVSGLFFSTSGFKNMPRNKVGEMRPPLIRFLDIFSKTKLGETKQGASAVKNLSEHIMNNHILISGLSIQNEKNLGAPVAVIRSQMSLSDYRCIFVYGPQLLVSGNSSLVYG